MSEHCPGCRHSDPTPQKVDPLGVRKPNLPEAARTYRGLEITRISIDEAKEIPEEEFMNASHGTMSKTMEHLGLMQWRQWIKKK
jgi:hypothetical protein